MNHKPSLRLFSLLLLFALLGAAVSGALPTRAASLTGGQPFLTGPNPGDPLTIAIGYLNGARAKLGLTSTDLQDYIVTDRYFSSHNGVTHIYLRQRHQGIEIFQANININIARDGSVINQGGAFIADRGSAANSLSPTQTAAQAVAAAAKHLNLSPDAPLTLLSASDGPDREMVFAAPGISVDPLRARLVYHVQDAAHLRLAWNMEINEHSGQHWWNLLLDAQTGEMLAQYDYVVHDDWGAAPIAYDNFSSSSENPVGIASANSNEISLNAPVVAASYNVFAQPKESPSDGPRTLVTPEDALASPFGWHDTNGVAGAEFTTTRGNNVYAYTDLDANNSPDAGSSPDGGAGLVFDFPLDLTQAPSTYRPFAVANLFYWNNIVHDVLYRYGFNAPGGNFQTNNYSMGGAGADAVQAEAQDGSGTNNANFATPSDGSAPRMQMFIWNAPAVVTLTVNSPAGIAGNYTAMSATFGPTTYDITADTIVVVDGTAPASDGCTTITNNLSGKIALIDRGTCNFVVKVKNAQNAGAIGVIMVNNVSGSPFNMGGTDATITIPSVMISDVDGALFKTNLPNVRIRQTPNPLPNRDSDLDAGVIAHEYAHGLSNRLTGGPSNVNCLTNQEQMGEGWSDFIALVLTTDPADTAATPRGVGTYLEFEPPTGQGIRPTPYTTDMTINPSTYGSIATQVIPHGVGYVWASMLWEVYWNMVAKYGYNPDVYGAWNTGGNNLAIQLVVDGMKLQPCSPGFVDGRNAILSADQALTGGANYCAIYAGFAKRGLGYSASQGSAGSVIDGVQAFDMPPSCAPDILASGSYSVATFPDLTVQDTLSFQNLGSALTWTITEAASDCSSPSNLSWVSAGLTNGVTNPGYTTSIPVTFDASSLPPGSLHTGLLCINSNDPADPVISIPLTLQVNIPLYLPILIRP